MAIVTSPRNYSNPSTRTKIGEHQGASIYRTYGNKRQGSIDTLYHIFGPLGVVVSQSYERYETESHSGTYTYNGWHYPIDYGISRTPSFNDYELEQLAAEQFFKNASKLNHMQLGVALAEASKTVGLISSTALRLGSAYRNLRKGRIGDAFSALGVSGNTRVPYHLRGFGSKRVSAQMHRKALERRRRNTTNLSLFAANAWLEMRYGWTPLLYDVYGSAEAAAYLLHANKRDLKITGHYGVDQEVIPASPSYVASGKAGVHCRHDHWYEIENETIRNLNSLGLVNPASIAWELTPFSFVVDWFLPVGDWLESFSALSGLKHIEGTKTFYEYTEWNCNHKPTAGPLQPGKAGYGTSFHMRRKLSGSPSVPLPRFTLFDRMNGNRYLDALSLLTKAFLGGR